jgi:hypothetical protein
MKMTPEEFKKEKRKEVVLNFGRFDSSTGLQIGMVTLPDTTQIESFVDNAIDEAFKEFHEQGWLTGYKQGVEDEIECVKTSGEHLDLQEKHE